MADGCPIIGNDGVYGQVTTVMNGMWGNAQFAFGAAIEAMQELGSFQLEPITVNTQFNPDNQWWHVLRPRAPAEPELVFDPNYDLVPAPPTSDIGGVSFDTAPTFTETAPVIPVRTGPAPFDVPAPVGPPALDPVVVPDAPVIVLPEFPELLSIDLPPVPSITLPTFQGVRPTFSIATPQNTFGFDAEPYSSALVDKIRTKLSIMIDGKPGLPASAAQQMRDRAYSALDVQGLRAEQEAIEEFASRGFSEPDGVLRRKLAEVRQNNQNQRNALARDVYLKDVDVAIEDLRFAVAQGIALEGQLMANFLGTQQLMLDAAKTAIQVSIDIANAEIAIANLELEAFKADAQVFRDLIQAELAKLEIYKAQLDGQRLRGELNQQNVQIYSERVKALLSLVEIYKAQVAGAEAQAQVNLTRTQAFVAQVSAYSERVKAYDTEWNAFGKTLEADLSQYRRYELATQVFGNRVKIWGDINSNKIDQKKLQISEKELDITAYRALLEKLDTVLRAETARLDSTTRVYASRIDKYRADAAIEQIVSDGNGRVFQLGLEQETQRVQASLKNAELKITQAQETGKLMVGKLSTIAQTSATMAAGFASAMHVGADISSRLSQGQDCNTSFNYSITAE